MVGNGNYCGNQEDMLSIMLHVPLLKEIGMQLQSFFIGMLMSQLDWWHFLVILWCYVNYLCRLSSSFGESVKEVSEGLNFLKENSN